MTQDIVDKLRGMYPVGATPFGGFVVIRWHCAADMTTWRDETDLCKKAADEIERLRAELRTYTDGSNDDVQREAV